ncbi:TetR/AcrR family transcriptional regulator [Saccharothrix algeriensis]|uniref:AcrR family transcriptional regulator n=1 Tax=Saccharothrix algeriensis TaxID=173560 RepID=A0A8T8I2W2_9PSEU|nr:TetR/AcrR family transcriptional regulator [Saccharothrix algeriensis]MBM7811151.1 AcrR family transcriptional regulator [Saccharothrix algeriensis]QTR05079.1 TetR/AcrR family transcriptional regulator [Saccharothrix algeriensis]
MPGQETADGLLARVVDHVARHGIADLSLRRLAAGVGTSHRMLIYHFGSKEGLLVAVARAVEARQRELLASLPDDDPAELGRAFWRALTDPALRAHERLFFELYGQAVQGRPGTTALLDGVVDSWVEPVAERERRRGHPPERARARARLGLAVARGLLLDLVATDDEEGVTAAMDLFLEMAAD